MLYTDRDLFGSVKTFFSLANASQVCAPVPLGAASLAAAVDEDALVELLYPVSFAGTKASRVGKI